MGARSIALTSRARKLRCAGLALGCLPLAVAGAGFAYETSRTELALREASSSTERDMNIVLIVIDTLRADHLGSYGYALETTPFLDSLAAGAVRFERCHAAASWTKPSVASILTSLYPGTHGANHFQRRLPTEARTLAELLGEAGFLTYAYVTNANLKAIFDFDQGFDFFDDHLLRDRLYLAAVRELPLVSNGLRGLTGLRFNYRDRDSVAVANARILPWLERYKDQNFFMYLHYMEPHTPYSAPASYAARFARGTSQIDQALAGYDGDIRYLDDHLAPLFARFEELGIYDKTLFVITSDHGEAFGEHGSFGHDRTVYQEQLHVPLIVAYEGNLPSGVVVDTPVRSIDIAPTLLDFAGAAVPDRMEGASLRGLMTGEERPGSGADIFVDHYSAKNLGRLNGVIRAGRWKYILTVKSELRDIDRLGREELYDLEADPAETTNLVGHPGRAPFRAARLVRRVRQPRAGGRLRAQRPRPARLGHPATAQGARLPVVTSLRAATLPLIHSGAYNELQVCFEEHNLHVHPSRTSPLHRRRSLDRWRPLSKLRRSTPRERPFGKPDRPTTDTPCFPVRTAWSTSWTWTAPKSGPGPARFRGTSSCTRNRSPTGTSWLSARSALPRTPCSSWTRRESIVWSFNILEAANAPQARLHHDSERLANGNTLILAEQSVINPGISPKTLGDDMILEVDPSGSIVWTWETHDHFDEFGFPNAQKKLISQKGGPWAHANSISVIPANNHPEPAFAPGNIIISYRSINTIAIIDKASGSIVWNSGPNRHFTWGQHFPNMIPPGLPGAGNIVVFDNGAGTGYNNKTFAPGRSRVYEIDPSEWPSGDFVVWQYQGGQRFFSNWVSGAMRLPNGNTLICSGSDGRLFEVDTSGAILWEYMSPHFSMQGLVKNHFVFRAYRLDYSWLP